VTQIFLTFHCLSLPLVVFFFSVIYLKHFSDPLNFHLDFFLSKAPLQPPFERLYQAEGRHKAGKMSLHPHTLRDLNEKAATSCRFYFPLRGSARALSRFHISESDNTTNAIQFTVIEVELKEGGEKLFPPSPPVAFFSFKFH
jgi:hypothetical protein